MSRVQEYRLKIKRFLNYINQRDDLFIVLLILLVGFGGFGLGRLSVLEEGRERVKVVPSDAIEDQDGKPATVSNAALAGKYVASVNGSKYHFPWCSGAERMKEGNKIWFDSVLEAQRAGYTPARNCKGLE